MCSTGLGPSTALCVTCAVQGQCLDISLLLAGELMAEAGPEAGCTRPAGWGAALGLHYNVFSSSLPSSQGWQPETRNDS